ncbi:MAG: hypothetical protein LBQ52_04915 [Helicobacteraceae bacterium]|jgi:hypothetical protein|nr:hypothetical protein [Helicobacteraceae bacterium]
MELTEAESARLNEEISLYKTIPDDRKAFVEAFRNMLRQWVELNELREEFQEAECEDS